VILGTLSPELLKYDVGTSKTTPRFKMSTDPLHEEDYVSEEDSDFAPDDAPAEESSVSDDDEPAETEKQTQPKRRRENANDAAEDAGFENSGDEAIIEKGKKRRKKAKRKDEGADEDEGGEGGLIRTRRMRAVEYATQLCNATSHFAHLTLSLQKG
jgi:hypothetical protein